MLGNSLGYMATTCMILLVGGCFYEAGSFRTDPAASAASQAAPRREDYNLDSADELKITSGEAVEALITKSSAQANAGEYDKGAATLERALQIEPKNAYLYSRLAALRILQERYEEAEVLAAKSNSLANRNARLQEINWRLIAESRGQRDDESGSAQATQRANQLREFIDQ